MNNTRPPRQGQKRQLRNNRRRSAKTKSSAWKSEVFVSVLSSPFAPWNDLEIAIGDDFPDWSLTHRSHIVQHLVRFLELKVLTEEFAQDNALLAPTPLVALAWQAVIHDGALYNRTIHTIQEFHGRPKQLLRFSLQRSEYHGKVDQERLDRAQVLFKAYYHEPMIASLEDPDDVSLEDTSAITDHFFLRCGGAAEKNTLSKKKESNYESNPHKTARPSWWPCHTNSMMDVIGDLLFCQENEEKSQESTVVVDDIEEENDIDADTPTGDFFRCVGDGGDQDYDSAFTLDFLNTRNYLCRQGKSQDSADVGCHLGNPGAFSW
jgi:hypothetical protein